MKNKLNSKKVALRKTTNNEPIAPPEETIWSSYPTILSKSVVYKIIRSESRVSESGIDIIYALPVSILGMWGPLYLDLGSGWTVGTWVTTVVITLYGTWLAKTLKLTGAIYIVQGIIILVPGSRVLVGASESLLHESILSTPDIGLSALLMFSAIVTGQITAFSFYSQKNRYLIN